MVYFVLQIILQCLRDLDRGFVNFFQKRASHPTFKSKQNHHQSYRTINQGDNIRIVGKYIKLPKSGFVKIRQTMGVEKINNVTIERTPTNKYFAVLNVKFEPQPMSNKGGKIGIDVGIKEFYSDSNGNVVYNPKYLEKSMRKLIREQRKLSRKEKGSTNRNKQRVKVALVHEKITNQRNDFLQKQSTMLIRENQTICIEDLKVKNMMRNHKLAQHIGSASWSKFFDMLSYKSIWYGNDIVKVPTMYPSSQTCSCCGFKNPLVKNLAIRKWECPECHTKHDRDTKDRKKEKQDKAEIKIGIAYDGWRKTGPERYALENKVVVAGFSKAKEFQEYREAVIAQEFNLDEVSQRILNAEGASWIKKVKDKSTCFQLDPFHRNKAVKEKIHERTAREAVLELLREEEIEEVFRYLEIYRNSLSDDDEIQDVEELIRYYENNREGLLPYQSQGLDLPEPPEGLEYRNMGTMENHVWSVIAKRMKHGHRSWSRRGGNHLAKILAKKCSGKLYEVTERLRSPVFEEEKVEELYGEILMSAKAPKKEEKGYEYPVMGHVVGLDGKIQGERKRLLHMAGY